MKAYNKHFLGNIFQNPSKKDDKKSKLNKEDIILSCPLCGSQKYVIVGDVQISNLSEYWMQKYKFNPIDDRFQNEILEKRCCEDCGLYFYNFHIPDSDEMYEHISEMSNYYPRFRSTYGIATEYIEKIKPNSLLEIGCGYGSFLIRIQHIVPNAIGSEYNARAVKVCKKRNLNVMSENIEKLQPNSYDIVCHFEVLEHIFDTRQFMSQSLNLLKKGGKLIIATPDPEGVNAIIGKFQLNLPPHHQYDFSEKCFKYLAKEFNLKIVKYEKTELEYRLYVSLVKQLTGTDLTEPDMVGFYETQKRLTGGSHLVIYEKK